jgi:hypothetical protein
MPLLATLKGVDEWRNSAKRWASLDIFNVGGWRKKGGKVNFFDKN